MRRRLLASFLVLSTVAALTGCGGSDGPTAPPNQITEGRAPDYYPAEYAQLIEASKAEGGELAIYSNTDQENWAPIFRDFRKKYPWVTRISASNHLELGGQTVQVQSPRGDLTGTVSLSFAPDAALLYPTS